jgi:hypothetical protein
VRTVGNETGFSIIETSGDRNGRVHNFIEQHDLWSVDGCRRAEEVLASAYDRIDQSFARLREWAEDMDRVWQHVAEYAQSDEFRAVVSNGVVPDGSEE